MNIVEKRKYPRIESINLSYVYEDKKNEALQKGEGRTINISEGGFLLETDFQMKKKYILAASISLDGDTVEVKGKVVHCRSIGGGKYVAGVQITSIESDDKTVWRNFIDKLFSDAS